MSIKLTFVMLIGISISVVKVDGLQCYVCGDEGEEPCNDFDLKKDSYAEDCKAPNDKGCEKITEGNTSIRKCSDRKFHDCQAANGVQYCYCFTSLCNGNMLKVIGITDDEDLLEGSGKTILTRTEKPVVITKEKSGASNTNLYCSLVVVPFVAMFYK